MGLFTRFNPRRARAFGAAAVPFHDLDYLEDLRDPRPVKEICAIRVTWDIRAISVLDA